MDFIITPILLLVLIAWLIWRCAPSHVPGSPSYPTLRNKRICLVIAHPDDEAMFFAPILIALTKPELKNKVRILCFSTGNAENLGATRSKELTVSALLLGLKAQQDITLLDDPQFPDSMTATWPASAVARVLQTHCPASTTDILLTFDAGGISSHPNHISLHAGAHAYLGSQAADRAPALFTLTTTGLARKYAGALDVVLTFVARARRGVSARGKGDVLPAELVAVGGWTAWRRAQRAMVRGHASQMRWFRWGWIWGSRYMLVNELRRELVGNGR